MNQFFNKYFYCIFVKFAKFIIFILYFHSCIYFNLYFGKLNNMYLFHIIKNMILAVNIRNKINIQHLYIRYFENIGYYYINKMNSINSLKNRLIEMMLFLDVFGQYPDIRILNKTKFSTIIGFVFSMGLVVLTSIYFIIEYINMIKFINPNVVSAQTQIIESSVLSYMNQTYYLLPKNFTIAITVADININPIKANNTHYSIVLENCVRERILDQKINLTTINSKQLFLLSSCTTIPLETCSMANF